MSRSTAQIRGIAERLIAHEATVKARPGDTPAVFLACEKLRPHLATLMGRAGHRALLSRSLALAGAEVPWLRAVHVRFDGSLEGLNELHAQLAARDYSDGRVALLAELLGLLQSFIGEALALQVLGELWPELSLGDPENGKGGQK